MSWRFLHRWYAYVIGYYWGPCPKCGKMVGGHEKHGEVVWEKNSHSGYRCCWECRDIKIINEEKNGICRYV